MTSDQMPLVSVVTPAYNEEQHIRECIESVLAQTYPHWDYTIVNNRSTDRTLEIALEYAAKDPRIRVVNNETFVPVIANYNIAFRQVSPDSKYCKVVAGDDWLFPECLERMVYLAEERPSVAIVGAYSVHGARLDSSGLPFPTCVVSGREVCRMYLLAGPYLFGAPTPLLFRSDIVRGRQSFYSEPALHADAEACFKSLEHHDFGFVHQILTFNRVRDNSLTSKSQYYNVYLSNMLEFIIKFGPTYLSQEELSGRMREQVAAYYNYFGEQLFKRRDREFWRFHRNRLAQLGYSLNRSRVLINAAFFAMGVAIRRLRRRL